MSNNLNWLFMKNECYSIEMSVHYNRNYRIKVDGHLCGYSSLCLRLGFDRAHAIIRKCDRSMTTNKRVFRAVSPATLVVVYLR